MSGCLVLRNVLIYKPAVVRDFDGLGMDIFSWKFAENVKKIEMGKLACQVFLISWWNLLWETFERFVK